MKRCKAPKGFALVPLEPTREMLSGWIGRLLGGDASDARVEHQLRDCYRRMLDHRPQPSASNDEAIDGVQCEACGGNGEIVTDWSSYSGETKPMTDAVAECEACSGTGYQPGCPAYERAMDGVTDENS